ncbi:uncharacterized protein LOC114307191 [Camellia sinensis]|uniref:uncharacterized protein LOC114307191 n=1 Tax=Camellia sinensis TaxID=4442 RepID=UPI00103554D1|nr:uncharacterized protein LOC114307191 [Camellia sinensis]
MATSRHSRNGVNSISVGDMVYKEPRKLQQEVCLHFIRHFSEEWKCRPSLDCVFKIVRSSQAFEMLEVEFLEDEIWAAIENCEGNKAPGPDGFNLLCYQKHWKKMKGDLIQFMKDLHTHGKLVRANEVADGWKKAKRKGVILKLDFEKACDSINWEFLFLMLSRFGFRDELEVVNIKRILRCFELISGLKINFHKSVVCEVGVEDDILTDLVVKLNCKIGSLPLNYLGLPMGANPSRRRTWKLVLDKVKASLAGWKRRMLSFASRLIVNKLVLLCLPIYYLSLFRVKWEKMTIDQGVLGIRKVRIANSCLLLKWWWRFACETNALWRRVICSKHNIEECC